MLRRLALAAVLSLAVAAALTLTGARGGQPSVPAAVEQPRAETGAPCASCHAGIAAAYRRHGMSRSLGRAGEVAAGVVGNPATGVRYEIAAGEAGAVLTATSRDGGTRRQAIVGRIGAGIFDTSWAAAEIDPSTGRPTPRLFFSPVETIAGRGLTLAPFDLHAPSPGVDLALTSDCLTCHTGDSLAPRPFPANDLGADAFARLSPITCAACHGDGERHARTMAGERSARAGGTGLRRLRRLTPASQRDLCARCHLQGDARLELVSGAPDLDRPLSAQVPVLVPARASKDFRFVGQLERLSLSACFKASASMTCTTCHDPHTSVAAQGTASFDAACAACHAGAERHAQSRAGCVGCHVRRSQPFDLPHVRTADHFIRARIEPPESGLPYRQFAERDGELALYDDGRLAPALQTAAGRRWRAGVTAMGLMTLGRFRDAAAQFESFPAPGSAAARAPAAPPGLVPLETHATFHTVRGLALIASGRIAAARAALSDAIALDPRAADARLARARLALDAGDIRTAMVDTQAVIDAWPQAEQPWNLRVEIAQRAGRLDLALTAADASTRLWPSSARMWLALASLAQQRGDAPRARQAIARVRALSPPLAGRVPTPDAR